MVAAGLEEGRVQAEWAQLPVRKPQRDPDTGEQHRIEPTEAIRDVFLAPRSIFFERAEQKTRSSAEQEVHRATSYAPSMFSGSFG